MARRLTIDHLEMIVAIADCKTLTEAARRLNLSQPALSYRVQEAERRLGVALFSRARNRLRMTPVGEGLCLSARRIIDELAREEADVRARGQGVAEVVRIGTRADASYRWLARFIHDIKLERPEQAFEIVPRPDTPPLDSLKRGEVDLEILLGAASARGVTAVDLFEDELVALLPADHPLADAPKLLAPDFEGETYVTYSTRPEPGLEYDLFFAPGAASPSRFTKIGLVDAVIEAVRAGLGVTILGRRMLEAPIDTGGLAVRPLGPKPLRVTWRAAYAADAKGTSAAARVARDMATWCRKSFR